MVNEWLRACGRECGADLFVDFQVQGVVGDQADHQALVVNAVTAEHLPGADLTQRFQQFE